MSRFCLSSLPNCSYVFYQMQLPTPPLFSYVFSCLFLYNDNELFLSVKLQYSRAIHRLRHCFKRKILLFFWGLNFDTLLLTLLRSCMCLLNNKRSQFRITERKPVCGKSHQHSRKCTRDWCSYFLDGAHTINLLHWDDVILVWKTQPLLLEGKPGVPKTKAKA